MKLADIPSNLIKSLPQIVGISPNAFSRVVPSNFLDKYSIVCFKERFETSYISRDLEVFSVQREYPNIKTKKTNAKEILSLPVVQEYIESFGSPWILVYKSTPGIEKICKRFDWRIIGTPSHIRDKFENKKEFRECLVKAQVKPIEGEVLKVEEIDNRLYQSLKTKYAATKFVFQIAEMTEGGGTGTSFIGSDSDFLNFIEKLKEKWLVRKKKIEFVTVTKFIEGTPSSIFACVTKYGILVGRVQTQLQDIPEVRITNEGSGLFCGHDWSYRNFSENIQNQAKEIARKLGELLLKEGFKGVFGVDLIVDGQERVYPIECNPRLTDAFPVVSMIYLEKGIIPMDYFHILEHLGVDYDLDVEKTNQTYDTPLDGSQILLETKSSNWTLSEGGLKAGIYQVNTSGELSFVKEGYRYEHIENDSQYLVTEGVPFKGTIFKPSARVLRLVSRKSILKDKNKLNSEARMIIREIYNTLSLKEIETPEGFEDED